MALTCLSSSAQKAAKVTNANKPFYMRVGIGYGLLLSGQNDATNGTVVNVSNEESFNIKQYSYGAGLSGTLALGYNISKNLGVELIGTSTIAGRNYTFTSIDEYSSGGTTYTQTTEITSYGSTFLLQPSIVVQTGGAKANIYARMGVIVPVVNSLTYDIVYSRSSSSDIDKTSLEHTMYFSLGATGAVGASYNISTHLRLFSEICMVSYSPYVAKGSRTSYSRNGVEYLGQFKTNEREYEFEKTGTIDSSPDPGKPTTLKTQSIPFSNIGINAGIVIQL